MDKETVKLLDFNFPIRYKIELVDFLLRNEEDIASDYEDYGILYNIFEWLFEREPK